MLETLERIMSLNDECITPHLQQRAVAFVIHRAMLYEGVPDEEAMAYYHQMTDGWTPPTETPAPQEQPPIQLAA